MYYYIHIPFCQSKCKYCHFASFANQKSDIRIKYLDALCEEMNKEVMVDDKIDSIYFGWWTPSVLNIWEIDRILSFFRSKPWFDTAEITLEANPENISKEYLNWLLSLWINRLSLWIQSLNENALNEIWRCSKEKVLETLFLIEESAFENIGVDFIIGLPYVSEYEIRENLSEILKLAKIKHISIYMLEEGNYPKWWKDISLPEEKYINEYEMISNYLKEQWFSRYEISNFAKIWYECRHNKAYWNHLEYRWYWLAAASYIWKRRFANAENFTAYFNNELEYEENLSEKNIKLETLMFDFRTTWIKENEIENKNKLQEFVNDWLIIEDLWYIKPTYKWIMILDYILSQLI